MFTENIASSLAFGWQPMSHLTALYYGARLASKHTKRCCYSNPFACTDILLINCFHSTGFEEHAAQKWFCRFNEHTISIFHNFRPCIWK